MKRVLIITYYWPPSGGAGVQRWLKMVKYLRSFGWEPIIYTPENPAYPVLDQTLQNDIPEGIEIWKHPIWEPYEWYKKFTGRKKSEHVFSGFMQEKKKKGWKDDVALWIRSNFFIPDARTFWIKPSIQFLTEKLNDAPVNLIVSTGPPHSAHLIALGVKNNTRIPWIADFRDPWTKIDYFHQLKLTKASRTKHESLERDVLVNADAVSCVSWHWADDFKAMSGRSVLVITNGYDEEDFNNIITEPSKRFTISHIGSMNADRNHKSLWSALQRLCADLPNFKLDFQLVLIGKNDTQVYDDIQKYNLGANLLHLDYLPHNQIAYYQCNATVLLLSLGNMPSVLGLLPGKLFEYLAARRPILVIGPEDGDSSRIVRETSSGITCNFNDEQKLYQQIGNWYSKWKSGSLSIEQHHIEQYTRQNITKQMAALFDTIVTKSI